MSLRFPVAKLYYRHSDLTSTVRGRWQHIYYDALCRNFPFAVLCKSNQSVTALWNRMLPGARAFRVAMQWWNHLLHSRAWDSNNNREVAGGTNLLEFKIDYTQSRSDLHGISKLLVAICPSSRCFHVRWRMRSADCAWPGVAVVGDAYRCLRLSIDKT